MKEDNLAARFEQVAAADFKAIALCFLADGKREERIWNRGELLRRSQIVAGHLENIAAPGSRIMLMFDPGLEFVAAFVGCLRAGLIPVPVAAPLPHLRDYATEALRAISRDCLPDAVLTQGSFLEMSKDGLGVPIWLDYDSIEPSELSERCIARRLDDIAFLQYTSGSTGKPKGVMISHGNLHANIAMIADRTLKWRDDATIVSWLPMYHDLGLIGGLLHTLYTGARLVFMSPQHFLSRPTRWLDALSHYRGEFTGAPNFAYEILLRLPDNRIAPGLDLSCLLVAANCAEPVRAQTMTRFVERFAPFGLRPTVFAPCYGLAESTLMVTAAKAEHGPVMSMPMPSTDGTIAVPAASSGKPAKPDELAIVDPLTFDRVPDGVEGEIWVSSKSVALGYWGKPDATDATFHAEIANDCNGQRWLRSGDIGSIVEGELFVGSRLKDLIIVRGRSIHPSDIEDLVQGLDTRLKRGAGIAIGIDDECEGEAIVVVQEVRASGAILQELAAKMRRAIANAIGAEVLEIVFVESGAIPKTANGKLRRSRCKELYLDDALAVLNAGPVFQNDSVVT